MPATTLRNPETILAVDDNPIVLSLVVTILEHAKFRVLSAPNGAEAIELSNATEGRIDLLLSDVDMPVMSGPALGEALEKSRPELRVMLMSGGANENLLALNHGWAYIQKPFLPTKLIEMTTQFLRSRNWSQPGGQESDSRKDVRSRTSATVAGRPQNALSAYQFSE
jgi:CheY-like chemotaxis protein